MPYLKIQTNASLEREAADQLLSEASQAVARALGKSERYVMVILEDRQAMRFGGDDATLAFLELKSIGLPESQTASISKALCDLIASRLGVPQHRVYIEFADAPRAMWGWNGGTF